MDSELSFQWPGTARLSPPPGETAGQELDEWLHVVEREIQCLEGDRSAARQRIEELEMAQERAQSLIAAQRRRLLLLERQLEAVQVVPAADPSSRPSWLDRLLGGTSPAPTVPATGR